MATSRKSGRAPTQVPVEDGRFYGEYVKKDGPAGRVRRFQITTDSIDRDGDLVYPPGGQWEEYLHNPVVLWGHQFTQAPVGKSVAIWLTPDKRAVFADIEFATFQFADEVLKLYDGGFMNAVSIGFRIIDAGPPDYHILNTRPDLARQCKRVISRWNLLEISCVPIGSNPEALRKALAQKGLVTLPELRESLRMPEQANPHTLGSWIRKALGWDEARVNSLTLKELGGLADALKAEPTETAEGQEVCPKCGMRGAKCKCGDAEEQKKARLSGEGEHGSGPAGGVPTHPEGPIGEPNDQPTHTGGDGTGHTCGKCGQTMEQCKCGVKAADSAPYAVKVCRTDCPTSSASRHGCRQADPREEAGEGLGEVLFVGRQ